MRGRERGCEVGELLPKIFSGLIFFSVINQIIRAHNVKVFPDPKQILKNEKEK